jgi:hypothetical protein
MKQKRLLINRRNILALIMLIFMLTSCNENNDKQQLTNEINDSLCDVSTVNYITLYRLGTVTVNRIDRIYNQTNYDEVQEELCCIFDMESIVWLHLYDIGGLVFFNSCLNIACGQINVCGICDDGDIVYENFGTVEYVSFLFYRKETDNCEKILIYGEMKTKNQIYFPICVQYEFIDKRMNITRFEVSEEIFWRNMKE